jgi:hypothetical protein
MTNHKRQTDRPQRTGATLIEVAVIMPVFMIFVWGLIEFGHAFMVVNLLSSAAQRAAREGVADDVTTAQVIAKANSILSSAISLDDVTVMVKDASIFDDSEADLSSIDYASLPNIELDDMEPRELFVVYIEVPYDNVSILPPEWVTGVTMRGMSAQRHE